MVCFLKLLDPREGTGDISFAGNQQRRAGELFPGLVEQSRLHYWRKGDPIYSGGVRLLVGLAASFSLADLRLADVMNESLAEEREQIRVDVFNMATDLHALSELDDYYPILRERVQLLPAFGWRSPQPVVGVWQRGKFEELLFGYSARKRILELVGSRMTPEELIAQLSPSNPELFEGA